MENIKVSVVIPVYNVASYIKDCLYSVINQSVKPYECVIVDDCGNDDSMKICESIVKLYTGSIIFTIVHHEHNRGLSAARNTGVAKSNGTYILFLDSDDKLLPDCVKLFIAAVSKYPDVEMVQGGIQSESKSKLYEMSSLKSIDYIKEKGWLSSFYFNPFNYFPVNAWNKLLNRQFFVKNKLWFKEGLIHEDQLWMFWVCKSAVRISIVQEKTYSHATTPNSIMTTTTRERTLQHWQVILNEVLNNLSSENYDRELLFFFKKFISLYAGGIEKSYRLYEIEKEFKKKLKDRKFYLLRKIYNPYLCQYEVYRQLINVILYIYFFVVLR